MAAVGYEQQQYLSPLVKFGSLREDLVKEKVQISLEIPMEKLFLENFDSEKNR